MQLSLPVLLTFFLILSTLDADPLKLVGTDLLGDALVPSFERYQEASGEPVVADMIGTLPAYVSLEENRADLAIVAIPVSEELPEDRFELTPLCYVVAHILVNTGNPVIELSLKQLSGIFSAEAQQRIDNWGAAGITGPLASRSLQVMVQDAPGSVVIELFKFIALDSRSIKSNATYVKTIRELTDLIAADLGAIGVASVPPAGRTVKTVAVSSGESGSFAFGPTPENVYYGDYPLILPLYVAVPKAADLDIKAFIKILMSDKTAKDLEKAGFMPLPDNVRKRTIQDLDR